VICLERPDYVKTTHEFEFINGALEGIRILATLELPIGVITNQSVVGRRIISENELNYIHSHMVDEVRAAGGRIDAVFYCPHTPEDSCHCRKPSIGLFERASLQLGISLKESWFVGDKIIDEEAGNRAGCKTLRIEPNRPNALLSAAKFIINHHQGRTPAENANNR
jgi:histidinol-phosphate phosphatase family protein